MAVPAVDQHVDREHVLASRTREELDQVPEITDEELRELLRKGRADRDAAFPGLRPHATMRLDVYYRKW